MLFFLYWDLMLLSMKLLEVMVKLEVQEKCKKGLDFKNINLYSSEYIYGNNLSLVYAAATISDLKK